MTPDRSLEKFSPCPPYGWAGLIWVIEGYRFGIHGGDEFSGRQGLQGPGRLDSSVSHTRCCQLIARARRGPVKTSNQKHMITNALRSICEDGHWRAALFICRSRWQMQHRREGAMTVTGSECTSSVWASCRFARSEMATEVVRGAEDHPHVLLHTGTGNIFEFQTTASLEAT